MFDPGKGQILSMQELRQALGWVIFGPGNYLVPREDGDQDGLIGQAHCTGASTHQARTRVDKLANPD